MRISWRTEWPNWLLIVAMFGWAAASWPFAPERFPAHWNLAGEVDRYSGKAEGLLALPVTALVVYGLLIVLPRIDPGRANYARFAGAYSAIRLAITAFIAAMYAVTQLAAYGHPVAMSTVVPILLGLLFLVIGRYLGEIQPNWFVGIRTPWTLSSRTSWVLTHRLSGRLFVLMGSAFVVAGLVNTTLALVAAAAIAVACLSWMVVYSYRVWRTAQDRIPPTGPSR